MDDWIIEAQNLAREDNPRKNYLAYVIIIKEQVRLSALSDVHIMRIWGKWVLLILSEQIFEIMDTLQKQ